MGKYIDEWEDIDKMDMQGFYYLNGSKWENSDKKIFAYSDLDTLVDLKTGNEVITKKFLIETSIRRRLNNINASQLGYCMDNESFGEKRYTKPLVDLEQGT